MKHCASLSCAAVLLFLAAAPVLAQDQPAEQPEPVLTGECAVMAQECQATKDQCAQLAEKAAAKTAALEAWDAANGAKLEELNASLATAEDKEAVQAEIQTLEADRAKVEVQADADILSVLTPDQQATWQGYKMCQEMMAKHAGMNADQAAKCREMCNKAAKTMCALEGTAEEVEKAKGDIKAQLEKDVGQLTAPAAEEGQAPEGTVME
ncbi:MAG: hypothetical protein WBD63_02120 [Phycisphaerae bacterium]|nr:hypothetical protein [Phycisphaerae bacterium]